MARGIRTIDEGMSVNASGGITRNSRQESYDTGGSSQASDLAAEFMAEWRDNLGESKRLYANTESAIADYGKYEGILGEEYDKIEEQFGGLRDDLVTTSREDLAKRNELGGMFMDAASADYEGAAAGAMGDIASQAQIGRQNETRYDLARGMDPGSTGSKVARSKSFLNEAVAKVLASNTARNQEKLRVGQMAGQGMQLFDPNNTAGLAMDIQNLQTGVKVGQSQVSSNVAGMTNNLANSFTSNITAPAADSAGALAGFAATENGRSGGQGATTTYGGVINPGFSSRRDLIPQQPAAPEIKYGSRDGKGGDFGML